MSLLPPPLLLPLKLPALLPGRSRKLGIPEPQLLFILQGEIVPFKEKTECYTQYIITTLKTAAQAKAVTTGICITKAMSRPLAAL